MDFTRGIPPCAIEESNNELLSEKTVDLHLTRGWSWIYTEIFPSKNACGATDAFGSISKSSQEEG